MKKFARFLAASLTGLTLMVGAASAATVTNTNCTIENTGQGSVNVCRDDNNVVVNATCVNNIYVDNRNVQDAGTGDGSVVLNTSGGGATSGNATNSNNTVVTIGASCEGGVKTATPVTPPSGGQGGTTPAAAPVPAAQPAPRAAVTSLPETGSTSTTTVAIIGAAVLAAAAVAARFGLALYRRSAIR